MPLPAIVGIPFLAGVLGSLFAGILTFFAKYLTKRIALTAAFITASIGLFTVFFAFCWSVLQGLIVATPQEVSLALSFFVPSNAPACLGGILTVNAARWVYDWNTRVIQFRLNL
ncbi:DUF5455 family protein [Pseudomonas leptonychotis]|uniref:DUF5455 family protein n=1 Tax=Pseudomonas leptonychotis TaxID=2448482 RepID=UPI00386CD9F1